MKHIFSHTTARLLCIVFAMASLQLLAQKPANEFQIYGGGGLPISLPKGTSAKGFGADAGIGFTAFIAQQIGIHIGAGYGLSNVDINADNLKTVTHGLIDANNYPFDLHTTLSDYKETQKSTFFSVPVMLQFQPNSQGFYAMGGAKIFVRYQTDFEPSIATLNNAAYYPEFDNWATTQMFAGLGTFPGNTTNGNSNLGVFTMLTLEMGMKWQLTERVFLYTGAYIDYGLGDPLKDLRKPVGDYIAPENLINLAPLAYADNINPVMVGVKLRLAFARSTMRQAPSRDHCPPPFHRTHTRSESTIFNRP